MSHSHLDHRNKFDGSSDEDSNNVNDAASVITTLSNVSENSDFADECALERLEDKLCKIIDGLTDKSSKTR